LRPYFTFVFLRVLCGWFYLLAALVENVVDNPVGVITGTPTQGKLEGQPGNGWPLRLKKELANSKPTTKDTKLHEDGSCARILPSCSFVVGSIC
jgi:hypothetical protein